MINSLKLAYLRRKDRKIQKKGKRWRTACIQSSFQKLLPQNENCWRTPPSLHRSLPFLNQTTGCSNKAANNKLFSWTLGKQFGQDFACQVLPNTCSQLPAVTHHKPCFLWTSRALAIFPSEHILLQTRPSTSKCWSQRHLSHGPPTMSHVNRAYRDYSSHNTLTQLLLHHGSWNKTPTPAVIAGISTAPGVLQRQPANRTGLLSKWPFIKGLYNKTSFLP